MFLNIIYWLIPLNGAA